VAKQLWGEDRVTFEHSDGTLHSVPLGWTDVVPADPYLSVGVDAAGNATIVWARALIDASFPHGPETLSASAYARRLNADASMGPLLELEPGPGFAEASKRGFCLAGGDAGRSGRGVAMA